MVCVHCFVFTLAQEPNTHKNAVLKVLFFSLEKRLLNTSEARCSSSQYRRQTNKASSSCQYLVHDFLLLLHSTNSQHNLQVPTCLENTQPLISPMSPAQVLPIPRDFVSPTNTFQVSTMYSRGSLMLWITLGFRF